GVLFVSRGTREVGKSHGGLRMKRGRAAAGLECRRPSVQSRNPAANGICRSQAMRTFDRRRVTLGLPCLAASVSLAHNLPMSRSPSDTIDMPALNCGDYRGTVFGMTKSRPPPCFPYACSLLRSISNLIRLAVPHTANS
ncbi:MAG: hypothetical protein QOE02_5243, partial [Rhodospirillaceae bacterium]|nr:hypothetical protein [Rhodospirillaceae bacterium]